MFTRLIGILCFISLFIEPSATAKAAELSNAHIEAIFDANGLKSVRDVESGAEADFTKDAWSLSVNGDTIGSDSTAPAGITHQSSTEVVYAYTCPRYKIEVHYRLDPHWHFVTKQLVVTGNATPALFIRTVVPLDLEIKEQITSSLQPGAYFPQSGDSVAQSIQRSPTHDYGAFLRIGHARDGLLLTVENPYLEIARSTHNVTVSYDPDMAWDSTWGRFASDIAIIRPYRLSGETLPRQMVMQWQAASPLHPEPGLDRAEISAFADCVRAFLIDPASAPTSVEAGWTLNDYQIDVGTPEGIAEYKRIIDVTSDLGIKNLLYAPSNSKLADISKDTDTWHWEHVLWLNLGQKIRSGVWNPEVSAIPADVSAMIAYAKSKHVGLLAYVYPSVPFQQDPSWLATGGGPKHPVVYASLASRKLQDMLIRYLIAFKRRTGISGYSFDYTFLNLAGSSSYAQWYGWQRVMRALRRAEPSIIIDGRQTYQEYGAWSWLAGSYPHPSGGDEQPESFTPYPDLHFDRVSADRARFVNYWYRNYQFAPSELVPGYAMHQTERSENVYTKDSMGGLTDHIVMMEGPYRLRDWDYLGYRYSLLSSIATGGWNNVIGMIPARDPEEFRNFTRKDKSWIKGWLDWTVTNKALLRHTRTILGQPAMGRVDGTSAISGDHGFIFLFNPNYKQLMADVALDARIGLTSGSTFILRELYPDKGRLVGKPDAGIWSAGDIVHLQLNGTSATVLEVAPAISPTHPLTFNTAGNQATVRFSGNTLFLDHVTGEPGTDEEIGALIPDNHLVDKVILNGREFRFRRSGSYLGVAVHFAGQRFSQAQEIHLASDGQGTLTGTFSIPQRVFDQLQARKEAWPIPWTKDDYFTTWLAPARLLLYVQLADPRESMTASATLNGLPLPLQRAYTSVRIQASDFIGFYADLSALRSATNYRLSLKMPQSTRDQLEGVFFDNVEPQFTEDVSR